MSNIKLARPLAIALSVLCVAACGRTVVRPKTEMRSFGLPRPEQILVYDFAVTEAEVSDNREPAGKIPNKTGGAPEGELELSRQAANALAQELVRGLHDLGFPAKRTPRGTPVGKDQILIDGVFLDVEKGDRLERFVIGFGAGASRVDTEVHVYYGTERQKLLDFRTHADSGKLPGAATTMGAGAAVVGGVTIGGAVASAGMGAVKEYRSEVERMAGNSADQAVAYLSEFFAKQGWIRPDQARKVKLD